MITGFNANYTRTIDFLTKLPVGLLSLILCFPSIAGFSSKSSLAGTATVMAMDARKSKKRLVYEQNKNSENIYGRLLSRH